MSGRCQRSQPLLQRDLQAVGEERDKDEGFNPLIGLVVDRADCQVSLQFLECLFHLDQLQVERPSCAGSPPVTFDRSR